MLSRREQQELAAIELGLARDDPTLDDRLRHRLPPDARWPARAAVVGAVVAVLLLGLGLVLQALLLAAITVSPWALRRWRRALTSPSTSTERSPDDA